MRHGIPRSFHAFALTASLLLIGAAGVQAATLQVGPGETYTTIQAAIDAATAGDTIQIAADTYNERPYVDKSLTINGVDEATVIIDAGAGASGSYGFSIVADDVTVSNLTLMGDTSLSTPRYGFKPSSVANLTMTNITAHHFYRTGVDLLGVNGGALTDVTSHDNDGHGLSVLDCNNVTITNLTVAGNAWQGVSVATWGNYSPLGTSGIVFTGVNTFTDPFQIELGDFNNPGVPPAGDAIITYSTDVLDGADLTVQASELAFAVHGEQDDGPDHVRIWLAPTLADAALLPAYGPVGHFTGVGYYIESLVDTDLLHITPGCSIQAAIDAADPGDTIDVATGTYREQLSITKDLTIQGAGVGLAVVESPDPVDRTSVTITKWTGTDETLQAVVMVQNATVDLSDLTVDGRSTGPDHYYGIYFFDAGGSVIDCAIPGVLNAGAPTSAKVASVVATHSLGQTFHVTISGTSIPELQKGGILVMGPGATFTIEDNTVISLPNPGLAGNGIQVSYGASGTMAGNDVEGVVYTGDNWSATGILLFECGDVSMDGDYVHGCQSGINYSDWRWVHSMAVPVNLVFENLLLDDNEWPLSAQLSGDQSDLNVTITDCVITDATGDGVDIWGTDAYPGYYTGWENGDLYVDISGLEVDGVAFDGLWTDDLSGNLTNIVHSFTVRESGFMNCTQSAVNTGLSVPVDARLCWWNDVAGPVPGVKKSGGGTIARALPAPAGFDLPERGGVIKRDAHADKAGETIYGDVIFAGWLADLPANLGARPWALYTSPEAGGIGAAIEVAVDDEVIDIAAGTYVAPAQIVIDKDLTLHGAGSDLTIIEPGFDTTVGYYLVSDALMYVDHDVTATIENLAIDGTGHTVRHAIQSRGASATVRDCEIRDIYAAIYAGRGIVFLTGDGLVEDCTMTGIQRIGIHIRGAVEPTPPAVAVTGLSYTGKGDGDFLDYGVEFGGGGTGTVVNSVITDCRGFASSDDSESAGILVTDYYGTGTTADILGCILMNNEAGMTVGYAEDDLSVATITGCTIANNISYGVFSIGPIVDALGNWWGDPTGPLHPTLNPGGLGNEVSDNVLFDPYLTGAIVSSPDPLDLTVADPVGDMTISYLGGFGPAYGYSITVLWDAAVATATFTRPASGPFAAGNSLFQVVNVTGGVRIDGALAGTQPGITAGDFFAAEFTAVGGEGTQTVVDFTVESIADYAQPPVFGVPADDGLVRVDTGLPVVADVLITDTTITSTDWVKDGDTITVTATATDGGTLASVTCDLTEFGGVADTAPDGSPVDHVYTWTFTPVAGSGDGPVTATVTAEDGVGNITTGSDDITADNTAPTAMTGVVALPGHNQIHLSWDDASGLDANYAGVEFRYTANVEYPVYASGVAAPAADNTGGDLALQITGTAVDWAQTDRDIYTLAAFAYDLAGNYGPADVSDGNWDAATSYFLGDVITTTEVPRVGDGFVTIYDITVLGETYGLLTSDTGFDDDCDYGPTDDWSRFGIPIPDGVIGFYDLMIAAMNFGEVTPDTKSDGAIGLPVFAWSRIDADTWALDLVNETPGLKGLHLAADLPSGVTCTVRPAELMSEQDAPTFLRNVDRNGLDAGLAVLGFGADLQGNGTLLLVKTSQPVEDLELELTARDINNAELLTEIQQTTGVELPTVHALHQNFPNPFNPQTTISYALPRDENVRLAVYGVDGRLVRVLVNEVREAGRHEVTWRGDDEAGRRIATGTYFYVIDAGDFHQVRKLSLIK